MNWLSFTLGFLTFPFLALAGALAYAGFSRWMTSSSGISNLRSSQKTGTLGFSSRLIGEIGEDLARDKAEPSAKAS